MINDEFMLEKRLKELDPGLHGRFKNSVFALQNVLSSYLQIFPDFTDHTQLHSINVIRFCNLIAGKEQAAKMNADEIYVLLMSCYLHDTGMGISQRDYDSCKDEIGAESYFKEHPAASMGDFIRSYHHEFSSVIIKKYADFLEIPSPEHLFAVVQVSRGHRRTDLYDEKEYPAAWIVPGGNAVCLPYLAALIRLADEIDVAADRNPLLLYDPGTLTYEKDIIISKKHAAVQNLTVEKDAFILNVKVQEERIYNELITLCEKMQATLDFCRKVTADRTDHAITQKEVRLVRI